MKLLNMLYKSKNGNVKRFCQRRKMTQKKNYKSRHVNFCSKDTNLIFDKNKKSCTLAAKVGLYESMSKITEDIMMQMTRDQDLQAYKKDLLDRSIHLNFEVRFKKILRARNYSGRTRHCAAAIAMGIVRILARNKETALSFAECMIDLFTHSSAEHVLFARIGDTIFEHKAAMTEYEEKKIRKYYSML
jgi:hypothetical protein|tara:strand:+ start:268 stop:831 length:564 start_codon:yes stop_codon:yes gene_type:complete